ncbi:hypothetical protein BBAD15_g12180 [Beauveria bassiana D1-5]|uniref:Uncharacterized protein n=1 Tax=Beauveria bassiana D1-5 TaxID=1245745 RepID=A0A0A2V8F9_BEABA|nr:hypothetical protein BBAD15_g12180 [Beauveria bassiana D1-5]
MQILSVILFTSLATAAPAADKRACALTDYECMAATYGPIKPGDAASQPDKLIHKEADFDTNRNWGPVFDEEEDLEEVEDEDEEGDGSRPISFEPIKPSRPNSRPLPPVEHGSEQAGSA